MGITHAFGLKVRCIRKAKGISQEELATLCDLHRTYVGAVERGERNITIKNAERIAQALNEPLSSLFIESTMTIEVNLDAVLKKYQTAFSAKVYSDENDDHDILMDAFGITPQLKREHRQYWGRELGKCWESLVVEACKNSSSFQPALRIGGDEPCDLRVDRYAIDTKYRLGSGDSGTLKKIKRYGLLLKEQGYEPVFLFLREDNLPSAITACRRGGWTLYTGRESFEFIADISGFDLEAYLIRKAQGFPVDR